MKSMRDYLNLLENMNTSHGTAYLTVENWHQPQDPDDESFPYELNLRIEYEIYGRDIPARIRYDDYDYPEETAEIDTYKVFDADTDQPITNIPPNIVDEIETAILKDYRNPTPDYDDYR